ncbi:hypothetical protein [Pseudophaeobacter sp.]|jgi:hypothetical protein|uniref:hypothetical protein n=2 Tax=Pseudophaeobacter sp. TaxID=1971739 RepID=UPI0032D93517
MPTSLKTLRLKLQRRLLVLDRGFDRHLIDPVAVQRVDKYALQEGYVSALWQAWCSFCRELLIHSTQGAITASGVNATSPHSACGEMEIAYVAKRLSNRLSVNAIRPLVGGHQEHTWGDLSKLNLVASGIGCSNASSILSGLSACLRIEDLQLCRNASAHISKSTIQSVRASKVRYQNTSFRHPSDMMSWVDPVSSDFLWKSWMEEIELAADLAIQ